MIKRLKAVEPLQAGKMLGVLYAGMALVFVLLFGVLSAFAPELEGPSAAFAIGASVGMALAMPIIYGVMGFFGGLLGAFIYNLTAKWIGGLQFEFEDVSR